MMQPSFQFSGAPMPTWYVVIFLNKGPGPSRRQRRRDVFGNIYCWDESAGTGGTLEEAIHSNTVCLYICCCVCTTMHV